MSAASVVTSERLSTSTLSYEGRVNFVHSTPIEADIRINSVFNDDNFGLNFQPIVEIKESKDAYCNGPSSDSCLEKIDGKTDSDLPEQPMPCIVEPKVEPDGEDTQQCERSPSPTTIDNKESGSTKDSVSSCSPKNNSSEDPNMEQIYQCQLCPYSSMNKFYFSNHFNSHYDHKCPHCDFCAANDEMLKNHCQDVHDIMPEPDEDEAIRIPKVNAQGKVKTFRCKQCQYTAVTKMEFWEHSRTHIKAEKLLTCPKCPFVTEYKHHLEYHLRNHFGSKPFKCPQCSYSCVNKSMLNSHMKSHSSIYQYRCADCAYVTKYCHSLKLHLRKYNHKPSIVLNPDGSPNPFPIIDVYGTRRGPKVKKEDYFPLPYQSPLAVPSAPGSFPYPFYHPMSLSPTDKLSGDDKSPNFPLPKGHLKCSMCDFATANRDLFSKHLLVHAASDNKDLANLFGVTSEGVTSENGSHPGTPKGLSPVNTPNMSVLSNMYYKFSSENPASYFPYNPLIYNPLQLPKPTNIQSKDKECKTGKLSSGMEKRDKKTGVPLDLSKDARIVSPSEPVPTKTVEAKPRRRKGKAFKLERIQWSSTPDHENFSHSSLDGPEEDSDSINQEDKEPASKMLKTEGSDRNLSKEDRQGHPVKDEVHTCFFCDMSFKDVIMYTMHMGYHGYQNPFTCNMCGQQTADKVSFFLHIARSSHT